MGLPAVQVCVGQRVVMCKAVPADPSSLCSSEGVRFFNLALFLSHKHIQLLVSKQKKKTFLKEHSLLPSVQVCLQLERKFYKAHLELVLS